MLLVCGEWN